MSPFAIVNECQFSIGGRSAIVDCGATAVAVPLSWMVSMMLILGLLSARGMLVLFALTLALGLMTNTSVIIVPTETAASMCFLGNE